MLTIVVLELDSVIHTSLWTPFQGGNQDHGLTIVMTASHTIIKILEIHMVRRLPLVTLSAVVWILTKILPFLPRMGIYWMFLSQISCRIHSTIWDSAIFILQLGCSQGVHMSRSILARNHLCLISWNIFKVFEIYIISDKYWNLFRLYNLWIMKSLSSILSYGDHSETQLCSKW